MKLYLYFNDLVGVLDVQSKAHGPSLRRSKNSRLPLQRVRGNNRGQAPRSRDASADEESFLKRSVDAPAASTVRRAGLLNTITSRGSASRNHAAIRFVCFRCVPCRDRRAQLRRDARLSKRSRFLAMIAIECISNSTLVACLALFCREIILAAFLIMCNAAEIFFR